MHYSVSFTSQSPYNTQQGLSVLVAGEIKLIWNFCRPGATIGEGSTVGAGSVVTESVPPNCVAARNPAKVHLVLDDEREKVEYAATAMTLEEPLGMRKDWTLVAGI